VRTENNSYLTSRCRLKILLTQPLIDAKHIAGPFNLSRKTNTFLYGLAMLAAVARQAGHQVCVLDSYFNQTTPEEYISYLKQEQFDVVGCTIYTLTFPLAKELFEYTRQALPKAFTVAGGPHPTSLPKQTLREIPQVDCVVAGEGELTFIELLERASVPNSLGSVKGIAYRPHGDEEVVLNPPREFIADLDELPLPAYDLFPIDEYITTPNIVRRYPTVAMQITRGCPFRCAFCEYNLALGKRYRHRSPEKVIEELMYLKEKYKIRGIVFRDSTFTVDIPFLRTLCQQMIKNNLDLVWMCYSRTDVIAKYGMELLPLMKKAGCWQIGYGCESGNQKSLDIIHKEATVQNNVDAVQNTIKNGIMCSTTWIIALPGETKDDAWNTVELALRLASHVAKFFLPIPYPGTELEELCRQDGGLRDNVPYEDYEFYMPDNLVYVNPRIGQENMKQMLKKAYRRFYTKPKVLYRNLLQLKDWDMLKKYWRALRLLF
jgi:anaerobic magnesium-protoporphyrin IX monomethyl ester cyclase